MWEKSWFEKVKDLPSGWWNKDMTLWCNLSRPLDLSAMNKGPDRVPLSMEGLWAGETLLGLTRHRNKSYR
jgi:hypothetical protein